VDVEAVCCCQCLRWSEVNEECPDHVEDAASFTSAGNPNSPHLINNSTHFTLSATHDEMGF
jgi:hypothetical protein